MKTIKLLTGFWRVIKQWGVAREVYDNTVIEYPLSFSSKPVVVGIPVAYSINRPVTSSTYIAIPYNILFNSFTLAVTTKLGYFTWIAML